MVPPILCAGWLLAVCWYGQQGNTKTPKWTQKTRSPDHTRQSQVQIFVFPLGASTLQVGSERDVGSCRTEAWGQSLHPINIHKQHAQWFVYALTFRLTLPFLTFTWCDQARLRRLTPPELFIIRESVNASGTNSGHDKNTNFSTTPWMVKPLQGIYSKSLYRELR